MISNAGAFNTFERLLSPQAAAPAKKTLVVNDGDGDGSNGSKGSSSGSSSYEPSVQLVYLFVGLDKSAQDLGLEGSNYWLLNG